MTSQGISAEVGADAAAGKRRGLGRFVAASLILAGCIRFFGMYGLHAGIYDLAVSEAFTLLALLVLGVSTSYALSRVYNVPRITRTVLAGTFLIVAAQAIGPGVGLPFLRDLGFLSPNHPLRFALEEGAFVVGTCLLIASFYLCIFEADKAKARLQGETRSLLREIGERKRAEEALRQANAEVERRVAERTASLTEANRLLEEEIAERNRAEHALRKSEDWYRTLAEASQHVIYVINRGDVVEYVNSFAARQLGLQKEDIIGKPRSEFFPLGVSDQQRRRLQEAAETGKPVRTENRVQFQGRQGWQDTSLVPLKNEQGEVYAVLGVSRDITARKHAELALKESEEKYRGLIEGLREAVYRISIPDGRFEYIGPAAVDVFGYTAEHFMDTPLAIRDIIPADFLDQFDEAWKQLLEGKAPPRYVYKILDPDGNERWIYQSNRLIRNADGEVVALEGLCRNITEEKRARRILDEQRARLVESSKMSILGEIAANVAHEINNPLAVISVAAEQLERDAKRGNPDLDVLIRLSSMVSRNVSRIRTIAKGLRSFTRDGTHDPFEETPLRGVVEDTLAVCRERFTAHETALTVPEIPREVAVECRPTQLMEVLANLLNNALHAVRNHDDKWVAITVEDKDDNIEIAVTDSGTKIPPAVAERIFDPFYTTKEPGEGTGLGLSISKRIIKSHNGRLWLDATCPNTRFVIRIPKRQPHPIEERA